MSVSSLLLDLCAISLAGVLFGVFARAIKLPSMVGYLVAGYVIGPYSPFHSGAISDTERVQQFAELGIILLIFTVGLDLGFRRLKSLGPAPFLIGLAESLGIWFLGTQIAQALGYTSGISQFLAATVAVSSTTVILATLKSNHLTSAKFSDTLIGILLVEDLVAILMLVYLPALAQGSGNVNVVQVSAQLALSIFAWWLGGSILVPKVANVAQRYGGDELLLLASLGLCLGLSVLAVTLNFSSALGAFMMGAILADSRQNRRIDSLIKPLRQVFGVLFFVSFGMLFNPAALAHHFDVFFIFLTLLLLGKFALTLLVSLLAGTELRDALRSAAFMGVAGEFSFVIVELGVAHKFLSEEIFPVVVGVAVASIIISPIFALTIGKHTESIAALVPESWQRWHKSYANTMRAQRIFRAPNTWINHFLDRSYLKRFIKTLGDNYRDLTSVTTSATLNRLAPWDEYLSEIVVEQGSRCEGKSIEELNTRNAFQINIVGVERSLSSQIPPNPKLRLLPGDSLLVYGNELNIANFANLCRTDASELKKQSWTMLQDCDLHAINLETSHSFIGKSLRDLSLRDANSVTVLAVVRREERIKNPPADLILEAHDEVFVVGPRTALAALPKN